MYYLIKIFGALRKNYLVFGLLSNRKER